MTAATPAGQESNGSTPHTPAVTDDVRRSTLSTAVSRAVEQGARVEYQSDFNAVVIFGRPLNHILHLLLSVVTAGIWLIVWIVLAITQKEKRVLLEIDGRGKLVMTEPQGRR